MERIWVRVIVVVVCCVERIMSLWWRHIHFLCTLHTMSTIVSTMTSLQQRQRQQYVVLTCQLTWKGVTVLIHTYINKYVRPSARWHQLIYFFFVVVVVVVVQLPPPPRKVNRVHSVAPFTVAWIRNVPSRMIPALILLPTLPNKKYRGGASWRRCTNLLLLL